MVFVFNRENWCTRIASIIIFISVLFIIAFLLQADFLNDARIGVPGVRFVTVIALLISGNILLNIVHYHQPKRWEFARLYLALLVLWLVMLTVPLWSTLLFGIPSGFEHILDNPGADPLARPLAPVGGIVIFTCSIVAGMAAFIHRGASHDFIKWSGVVVAGVGIIAAVGHLLHQPTFYFETTRSLGTSPISAVLAILLGIGFYWSAGIPESESYVEKPSSLFSSLSAPSQETPAVSTPRTMRKRHARKV